MIAGDDVHKHTLSPRPFSLRSSPVSAVATAAAWLQWSPFSTSLPSLSVLFLLNLLAVVSMNHTQALCCTRFIDGHGDPHFYWDAQAQSDLRQHATNMHENQLTTIKGTVRGQCGLQSRLCYRLLISEICFSCFGCMMSAGWPYQRCLLQFSSSIHGIPLGSQVMACANNWLSRFLVSETLPRCHGSFSLVSKPNNACVADEDLGAMVSMNTHCERRAHPSVCVCACEQKATLIKYASLRSIEFGFIIDGFDKNLCQMYTLHWTRQN